MKPIISVEGLGKSYTIRHEGQTHYKSLREEIFKLPSRLLRRGGQSREEFWALKDVSFDIMPGDRVGIIGRNGAGKSTLLKLLSRITEPTTGRITLRGRVASLLEVGTGFHPELTGRENIYLNGAILGMSRAEVRRKFDEIVDFAGVEKFLDTPVKRYSSGMYVRLAFAVAAHLEPEILIVDEVLAVGDMDFQKKCLGKMEEIGEDGRTLLFVSHQMPMIESLCKRCLLMECGRLVLAGVTAEVMGRYRGINAMSCELDFSKNSVKAGSKVRLLKARLADVVGFSKWEFDLTEPLSIYMEYEILEDLRGPAVPNFHFTNTQGQYLCVDNMPNVQHGKKGYYIVECRVPGHTFNVGQICVGLALTEYCGQGLDILFWEPSALVITIKEEIFNTADRYGYGGIVPGAFRLQFSWSGGEKHG